MVVMRRRVMAYARENNALPQSLSQLPPEGPEYDDRNYRRLGQNHPVCDRSSGVVTLTSCGHDGKPGGAGEDADIIRRFASRKPDASWADGYIEWLKP